MPVTLRQKSRRLGHCLRCFKSYLSRWNCPARKWKSHSTTWTGLIVWLVIVGQCLRTLKAEKV